MILRPPTPLFKPVKPTGRPQIFRPPPRPGGPAPVAPVATRPLPGTPGASAVVTLQIVFPVCPKDSALLLANLEWMRELDGASEFPALLVHDATLGEGERNAIVSKLGAAFPDFSVFTPPTPPMRQWPQAPNWIFQHTARRMRQVGNPWLWMEPDAWPLKSGWLTRLWQEYQARGKPVLGAIVPGMGHCNGVAIYPADFCDRSPKAMRASDTAWDSVFILDLAGQVADASDLMQHAWGKAPGGGFTMSNGIGSPTFPSPGNLKWINPQAVLFHRCKDTTLVAQLRRTRPPSPPPAKVDPRVEIFIVSYAPDANWLRWNLRTIAKFAKGFKGVTIAVPETDVPLFLPLQSECPFRLIGHAPARSPAEAFLRHEEIKLHADEYCPHADFILHTDSDCVFTGPVSPADYLREGKPEILIEDYSRVGAGIMWKAGVELALGIKAQFETMRRHPAVHYRGLYAAVRQAIEAKHGMPFTQYLFSHPHNTPGEISEFNLLGSFALTSPAWREKYHWIDLGREAKPSSSAKLLQFWSRGPIDGMQPSPQDNKPCVPLEVIQKILGA